uniref:Venom peptide Ld1a n=1 Tax=Lethocerus distinctifemur TaxID=280095 RepID=A0A2K8JNN2_9HEMI|nr:venom peptide Ld1a [Lethocerus distinctifemur]
MAKHLFVLALIGLAMVAFVNCFPSDDATHVDVEELDEDYDDEKPRFLLPLLFLNQIPGFKEKVTDPVINAIKDKITG